MRAKSFAALTSVALIGSISVGAAQYRPPFTVLQRADTSVTGRETVVATYEPAPGLTEGWHTHPGEMVSYVVEGAIRVERRDQPPVTIAAGQSFIVPADVPHRTMNPGSTAARMVVTYFVAKDQALTAPAVQRN
jgi:quercetin dioxygenase-like cupin family protein